MDTAAWINAVSNTGFPIVGFYLVIRYGIPAIRNMFEEHLATFKEQRDYDRQQREADRQMVATLAGKIDTLADVVSSSCKYRGEKNA